MLQYVNERDQNVDKLDKIYKSRPVFDITVTTFQQYYVPNCELSLNEEIISTKILLSIKEYIKDKPIIWGLKTFM